MLLALKMHILVLRLSQLLDHHHHHLRLLHLLQILQIRQILQQLMILQQRQVQVHQHHLYQLLLNQQNFARFVLMERSIILMVNVFVILKTIL